MKNKDVVNLFRLFAVPLILVFLLPWIVILDPNNGLMLMALFIFIVFLVFYFFITSDEKHVPQAEINKPYRTEHDLPTPHQRELGIILMEECAEVAQRMSKMLRFGVTEVQKGQPHNNAYRLGLEVGDLMEMIDRVTAVNMIDPEGVKAGVQRKRENLKLYMQNLPDEDMGNPT